MSKIHLHITLTELKFESRVDKQSRSLVYSGGYDEVFAVGLHSAGLHEFERREDYLSLTRIPLKSRGWIGWAGKFCKYCEYFFRVLKLGNSLKPVSISAHSITVLPIAYVLSRLVGAELIYDTHELETEVEGLAGFKKRTLKLLERALIRKCSKVFVVSQGIANWYASEYGIDHPTVLYNAPFSYPEAIAKGSKFKERFNLRDDQVIFLYQGGLSSGRGVKLILDSFLNRIDDSAVIVFMGYGELEADIKKAELSSRNVFFHEAVSANKVLDYTSSADIGIHIIKNTCLNHYHCMPNKLFEYAMASLPVIVSDVYDMRTVVTEHGMGISLQELDIDSLNHGIDLMCASDLNSFSKSAYNFAVNNSWEIQEGKMLKEYNSLGSGK